MANNLGGILIMATSLATQINYSDYREPKIVDQKKFPSMIS
jgi:hypothetical protein